MHFFVAKPLRNIFVLTGNNLRVTSNVSNNLLLEGESVKFRCDIHHSGNIMPVIKWGSSGEVIPATTVRNIELIQSDIIFLGEQNTNGKELECSVFFEEIQTSETGVATNAPNCSLSPITQNIIVHCKLTSPYPTSNIICFTLVFVKCYLYFY